MREFLIALALPILIASASGRDRDRVPAPPEQMQVYQSFLAQMPYSTFCPNCDARKKVLLRFPDSFTQRMVLKGCLDDLHLQMPNSNSLAPPYEIREVAKGALGATLLEWNRYWQLAKHAKKTEKSVIALRFSEVVFDEGRTTAAFLYSGLGDSNGTAVFTRADYGWHLQLPRTLACTRPPNRYVNAVQPDQKQVDVYRAFLSQYGCHEAPGCENDDMYLLDLAAGAPDNPADDPHRSRCLEGIVLEPQDPSRTYAMPASVVDGLHIKLLRAENAQQFGRKRHSKNPALYYTFSGIAFDQRHTFAVLYYSVGSEGGATAILERKDRKWALSRRMWGNDCGGTVE